ncbi:hypothetical protein [Rickettsiella endosymbiont of Rhagonycha lignosa]|uniref:hypothetical protein n=1 Tax=Rickettsiella endosymbiont of Rhagonycha lignosa TaxID=3077937 RepID=UPI00313DF0E4
MLVTGELDHGLNECGILLEDNSNLIQLKGESSKNFKKVSLEKNTCNTQMWKRPAQTQSEPSEIKMSKKQKKSLKKAYPKQGQEQELNSYTQQVHSINKRNIF